MPEKDDAPEAKEFYRKALALESLPQRRPPRAGPTRFEHDDKKSKALLAEHKALVDAHWENGLPTSFTPTWASMPR